MLYDNDKQEVYINDNLKESSIEILGPNRDILEKIEKYTYNLNVNLFFINFMMTIVCSIISYKYLGERITILLLIMILSISLMLRILDKIEKEKNNGRF